MTAAWRWIAAAAFALALLVLLYGTRTAAVRGEPAIASPSPEAPVGRSREAALPVEVGEARSVVEEDAPRGEETSAPAAAGITGRLREWEAATTGIVVGRLQAMRGTSAWSSWRVYATSHAPRPLGQIQKSSWTAVDASTGTFRLEGLPLGPTELLGYHPVAGKGGTLEIDVTVGVNRVTMAYAGPDPAGALFLDVASDEPLGPEAITVTDGARSYWAESVPGEASRFFVGELAPGTYRVTIARPGREPWSGEGEPGTRLRVDLGEDP